MQHVRVPTEGDGVLTTGDELLSVAGPTTERVSRKYALNEAASRLSRLFEIPVLLAAALVVPTVIIEEQSSSFGWLTAASLANWVIWAVFFAEYLSISLVVEDRKAYARYAWLDVTILIVSFPALPVLFAFARLTRLSHVARGLQLLRMVRLAALLTRGGRAAKSIFMTRGVGYILILCLVLAMACGVVFALVEGKSENVGDGLWWAVVTLTTVGYGDLAPATGLGRLTGVAVMVLGLGFVAALTAVLAAHFVTQSESLPDAERRELQGRVEDLGNQLERIEGILLRESAKQPATSSEQGQL